MKRRNYTREILDEMRCGGVPVASVLNTQVSYEPRSKSDPRPWAGGGYRYTGREIHTVPGCGQKMITMSGNYVFCVKPEGHDKAHVSR